MKVRIIGCSDGPDKFVVKALSHRGVTIENIGHVGQVVSITSELYDPKVGGTIPHEHVDLQNLKDTALLVFYTVMFDDGSRVLALNEELAFL